ncbi:MAG: protein kinase [Deltaproteobacteria bacterium]|nr:protein kinase [Deltaproteobacteria bacterium]
MLEAGTVLDNKWVILESLGKGGMGEVYRAHQLNLKRDVAIKIVSRDWLETLDGDEEELENALSRFRREVKATASIRHPNVIQIIDYGSTKVRMGGDEVPLEYIAMEYIPGATLRFTMSEEGFEPDEELMSSWIKEYFFPLLEGVAAIHASGMVHRDLKPENVLMDGTNPKIVDFGLAASHCLEPITGSIDVKGTAAYMSPEQFVDLKRTDARTDIYALGKILYEAIAGKMPPTTIPFRTVELEHPEKPLFKELNQIIRTATAEKKEDRFESMGALQAALKEALTGWEASRDRQAGGPNVTVAAGLHQKWIWIGIFITLLAVSAMTVWHLLGNPQLFRAKDTERSSVIPKAPATVDEEKRPSEVEERPKTEQTVVTSKAPTTVDEEKSPREVEKSPRTASPPDDVLSATLRGKDGAELYLVPGGTVAAPQDFGPQTGKSVDLPPFYMSETLVTNHQYVEFLNEMLSKIEVEQGVVRGDGNIWLLLGEVVGGYDPIAFRDGRFRVTEAGHASCPVVRVTAYGASAYAAFCGRRLPTDLEWLHAVRLGKPEHREDAKAIQEPGTKSGTTSMMEQMHPQAQPSAVRSPEDPAFPSPAMLYPANALGIRGLNRNVGEWGIRKRPSASESGGDASEYVILAGQGKDSKEASVVPGPIPRQPWEAFEEVGFRCAMTASAPSTAGQ